MSVLLSFDNPLEFLLRFNVLTGIIVMAFGVAICIMAKRITMAARKSDTIDKKDRVFLGWLIAGISLILIGLIITALPIEATFYRA